MFSFWQAAGAKKYDRMAVFKDARRPPKVERRQGADYLDKLKAGEEILKTHRPEKLTATKHTLPARLPQLGHASEAERASQSLKTIKEYQTWRG